MKKDSITNYHMDKSITLFFVITILISATVFGYRYMNHTPCEIIDFDVVARNYRAGEIIRFKDNTTGVVTREWDFGDSSKVDTRVSPFHTYEKPGKYEVRLSINGKCNSIETITIKEKVFILDSTRLARFDIPETIKVGEVLKIKDKTLEADSWEWRFGETAAINSTKKNPEYIYKEPGLKTITLVVNGDPRYGSRKQITVLSKKKKRDKRVVTTISRPKDSRSNLKYAPIIDNEEEKNKEEAKAPFIGESEFKAKLLAVSKKKASANDFDEYLCGNLNLTIIVNKKRTSFIEFCQKIKGKGIKIKELELAREKNNCIKSIVIRYSKTALFG
ncbi:PKD domain-containing protein [Aquimarina sp. 2201CG5-10]|uniref:PKD domain-containing protein n=1 Tax=Aquimarina callyspongiae TaxID=3098150 RepID=UPI002AB5A6B9|nr:PKD domain-containing protein [Aquimarina sp. 2201CG5-10]MDY8138345.1 PKD domain-containing protein [Aquimarina sp. 2201CG5-10]